MRTSAKITTRRNDKNAPLSLSLFPLVTPINGIHGDTRSHALIGTVPEAMRAGFWAQPGLLNPRIRHAYRNHSDYPTRITMQMLVNSHVPAR